MNEEKAKEILGRSIVESNDFWENNNLQPSSDVEFIRWQNDLDYVTVDGELKPDQLEAIAWWVRHKKREIKYGKRD